MSINKNTATKVILIALVVAGLLVISALVARQYNASLRASEEQAKVQAQAETAKTQAEQAKFAELEARYQAQRIECEKGANAYNKLPKFYQRADLEPNCGPAVVR